MRKDPMHPKLITWREVDKIVDILVPQIKTVGGYDGIMIITRGGIIPGGLLAEALDITYVLTAAVRFTDPYDNESRSPTHPSAKLALPSFLQFPETQLVAERKLLLIDDVWGSGRTSVSIRGRLTSAGAEVSTCVFHYNPYRSLFQDTKPDFYGAVTDAYVVYPWEIDRGIDNIGQTEPELI